MAGSFPVSKGSSTMASLHENLTRQSVSSSTESPSRAGQQTPFHKLPLELVPLVFRQLEDWKHSKYEREPHLTNESKEAIKSFRLVSRNMLQQSKSSFRKVVEDSMKPFYANRTSMAKLQELSQSDFAPYLTTLTISCLGFKDGEPESWYITEEPPEPFCVSWNAFDWVPHRADLPASFWDIVSKYNCDVGPINPLVYSGEFLRILSQDIFPRFPRLKHLHFSADPEWSRLDTFLASEDWSFAHYIGEDWKDKFMQNTAIVSHEVIMRTALQACGLAKVRLESLSFTGCDHVQSRLARNCFSAEDINKLPSALPEDTLKDLKSLSMYIKPLDELDEDIEDFSEDELLTMQAVKPQFFEIMPSLEKLDLESFGPSEKQLASLSAAKLPKLTSLQVAAGSNRFLQYDDLTRILSAHKGIKHLALGYAMFEEDNTSTSDEDALGYPTLHTERKNGWKDFFRFLGKELSLDTFWLLGPSVYSIPLDPNGEFVYAEFRLDRDKDLKNAWLSAAAESRLQGDWFPYAEIGAVRPPNLRFSVFESSEFEDLGIKIHSLEG
ncbi:hypothetical protein BU16DRAFT_610733 [Lophium mytilinum]|uniref:Uncharacterized protein n=1 Tax=Lophium mytilinum TaxID=390894 RepID=A0A6A6QT39_9PEZI|nr:hypothetical protein BU16DRAFT_610733 [Lophium mytilinum]